jgi:predicted acylesterase/phospholipase RssA
VQRRAAANSGGSDDIFVAAFDLITELTNVTTDSGLAEYLSGAFKAAANNPRIPYFVSVYETHGGVIDACKHGLQLLGLLDAGTPHFIEISDPKMNPDDRLAAILASATLPFVCESGDVGGKRFVDGSFGGMKRSLGAVPLQPFRRKRDIHLDVVIIVHTDGGASWDATQFKDMRVVEVRPSASSEGAGINYFWPDKARLKDWIDLGESDAFSTVNALLKVMDGWAEFQEVHQNLLEAAMDLGVVPTKD